jgi:hypothetical protein
MRVTAYGGTAFSADLPPRERVYQAPKEAAAESRSLVVQPAPPLSTVEQTGRPLVAFLAQLMAKAEDMPETRMKRRIDPADGASIYRAAMDGGPGAPRSLRVV